MNGSSKEIQINAHQNQEKGGDRSQYKNKENQNKDDKHQINVIAPPLLGSDQEEVYLNQSSDDQEQSQQKNNNLQVEQHLEDQSINESQENISGQVNALPGMPRRRSLFGQQYDKETKQKKKKGSSKNKDTAQSISSSKKGKKKSILKDNEYFKEVLPSPRVRLKLVNNILENQIKRQQTLVAVGDGEKNNSSKIGVNQFNNSNNFSNTNSLQVVSQDLTPSSSNQNDNVNNSMTKKPNESVASTKAANPYDDFTLEDLKILQETIQINRQELQKELAEIQIQKKIKKQVTLQPQIARKWEKVKNSLMAFTMMRKIFNDIKKYGTSMQALSISDQVIEKCRDLLEKKLDEKKPRKYLVYHDSIFLTIWFSIMFAMYCLTAIYSPFKIFFKPSADLIDNSFDQLLVDYFFDIIFFLDIMVKMNTAAITSNGSIIENRKQIFLKYLKKGFILDVLQILPFEILGIIYPILDDQIIKTNVYNEILRIIRIPFLMNSVTIDQKVFDYFKIQSTLQRLIRFFFAVVFSVHIVGCLWVFIARVQYYDRSTWISENHIDIHDSTKVYLFAIYWCLQTLATVGFGDVHSSNEAEIIFGLFWMVIGVGFYSFAIGQLSKMFTDSESRQQKLTNSIYIMDEFCAQANLPKHINDKIRKALQYSTNKSILSSTEKEDFFDSIPTKLKTSLAQGMFKGMIAAVPFLKNKDSIFLANLLPMLQPLKLNKGDYIYKKDSYPNLVYFIIDGKVNFLIGANEMVFKSFLAGSYFGEIEIFHQCLRLFSVRCEDSCELLTLDRDYFGELMDKFPQVEQEMFEMVQQRQELMNESLQKIEMLLDLNENDNFWKNKEMKSFADILLRRKTQSIHHNEEENNNDQHQYMNNPISSNYQLVNYNNKNNNNNNMLSPSLTSQNFFENTDRRQSDNQNKSTTQSVNVNGVNNNQQDNNYQQQQQQTIERDNQRANSITSIGKVGKFTDEMVVSKSITMIKKTKQDYQQQPSVGSNSSSNNNIHNENSSYSVIPLIQSTKSLKNNNIVLNVFNEKQEAMLVEVYEEEVKQTKLLHTSSIQSQKNITEGSVQSNTNVNININGQGNIKRIQQKYGVSSLDRIEEKNSHFDIENLSNSYITNEQPPSLVSFTIKEDKPQENNQELKKESSKSISSNSSSSYKNNQQQRKGQDNKIHSLNNLQSINLPKELELSVGSIKNLDRRSPKKKKQFHISNGNVLGKGIPLEINPKENLNSEKNAQQKNIQDLKINLKSDQLQENANLMDELLQNEKFQKLYRERNGGQDSNKAIQNSEIRSPYQYQDSVKTNNSKNQPNQNNSNFLQSNVPQNNLNNSISSPEYLKTFGSKKQSEILDSSYKQKGSFSEALNFKITQTESLKYNSNELQQSNNQNPATKDLSQLENHQGKKEKEVPLRKQVLDQQRNFVQRSNKQRQDTLKVTENQDEQEQIQSIQFSDRMDKVSNIADAVPALNLKVQQTNNYETISVASSKKSLQEIVMIDTTPEQTPVMNRSRLSFQTRGSRHSVFQLDFVNEQDQGNGNKNELSAMYFRRNKFQRFQKTQTNLNTDSDEENKKKLKNLRQIKTINNLTEMENNDTEDNIKIKDSQNKTNQDFDIQSLNHLAKNDCSSPISEPASPINIRAIMDEDDSLNINRTDSLQVTQKELKEQNLQRKKQKIAFSSNKKKSKESTKKVEKTLKPSKTSISQKTSKERKPSKEQLGRSKTNVSTKSDGKKKELKTTQSKQPKDNLKSKKTLKSKLSLNDKSIRKSNEKISPFTQIEKKSIVNISMHTDVTSKNNLENKNRSLHSLNIQEMMKHIEDDFEIQNVKKTKTLFKRLTSSIHEESNEKKNTKNDGDISRVSSSSSSPKIQDEQQNDDDFKFNGANEDKLDQLRMIRKKKKSQTNMFEDRLRMIKRMGSIQSSQQSLNSPVIIQHKLQYSNSILSPPVDTPDNSKGLQRENSVDCKNKNFTFTEMLKEQNTQHSRHKSLERGEKETTQKNPKNTSENQKQKRSSQNKNKHKKHEIDKKKVKDIKHTVNNKMKKMQQSHIKEIKNLKLNVSEISTKLDSLTYSYENAVNLVSILTKELKLIQQKEEQQPRVRQLNSLPFPVIRKDINKTPISPQEMEDIDNILGDLYIQSPRDFHPLSMRKRNNSSDSNNSAQNTKRVLLNLGKMKTEDDNQEDEDDHFSSKDDDDDDDNNNNKNKNNKQF